MITAHPNSPPAFDWESWYAGVGGRPGSIAEVHEYLRRIYEEQYPRFDGPVAPVVQGFSSKIEAANWVKQTAMDLGASLVGICNIEASDIYRGRSVNEGYAIALGMHMQYKEFQDVPSVRSAIECLRVYFDLGNVVIALADALRARGVPCKIEHPIGDSSVLHIPIGLKAGLGELGRHGSIINPRYGPLFRMGSILTNLEMQCDAPIDAGIAKFCDSCRACRLYCPANAIPDERSTDAGVDHLGNARYVVDTGKCFSYFAKHHYCSACLPVCVYNHKEWARDFSGEPTALFPTVVMHTPPPACDNIPPTQRHHYPHVHRDTKVVDLPRHAVRGNDPAETVPPVSHPRNAR